MNQNKITDTHIINEMIVGRVEPHIYAFETCSVPNYLKIGDTYRPVYQRIEEWKRHYEKLQTICDEPAIIGDKYFRDYSVHSYIEGVKGRKRITDSDFSEGLYHSKEFFRDATSADIKEAIEDIHRSYNENSGEYKFYSMDNVPEYRKDNFIMNKELTTLRDNQKEVVENFKTAIGKGRTKLLMYAVMRFGKSLTAMTCAEVMPDCKLVVIVSAKADVKDGWECTIKTIKNFEDFIYADGESLKENPNIIGEMLSQGKKIALCLTLQDISTNKIKERYRELFNESIIDLLIVDETHFGARAEQFGKVLQYDPSSKKEADSEEKEETFEELNETIHALNCRVQLHLSGTPYRILMGNEFSEDDIICQCTYPDIIQASKEWDAKHLDTEDEWENPYYGFPQMIRFAFNFNSSSLKKIEELKKQGKEYFFDALFEACKDADGKYCFVHEAEVLDFLKAINSGDEDPNIFSFLDNDSIKDGKLCHHVVMVLPRRASCDAMENLLMKHPELSPLSEYVVINAAGKTNKIKKQSTIKQLIRKCENEGKKTITLTVNRMLTGTTVPEWDTMIFLKGTSSPQEYDQAIYRLQNQFIKEYKSDDGKVIKYNMKPQTLLIDFSPERMFVLQEQRAFYSSVNSHEYGNDKIQKEIERELEISPIIYLNHNKLQQVTAVDILDKIRKYSSTRSIMDEAREVGIDYSLKDDNELYAEIMRYAPIGSANIMRTKAHEGEEETEANIPADDDNKVQGKTKDKAHNETEEKDSYEKRLATYYSHILFFAYLTKDSVRTLSDICTVSHQEENKRISENLGLNLGILPRLSASMHPARREMLEFKISNINELSHDSSISPSEKVENAMRQFGRWSESEIITPANIADDMIALIPEEEVDSQFKFLDIAAKEGEFANAIYKRFGDKVKNNIYSVPTSGVAYEFTRKVYEELGLPVENIFSDFTSYDLIPRKEEGKRKAKKQQYNYLDNEYVKKLKDMNFNAIVGNPPYQEGKATDNSTTTNKAFSSAIYPDFINISIALEPQCITMITPSRWLTNQGQGVSDDWVDEMIHCNHFISIVDYQKETDCFPNVEIKGGVNYFLFSPSYNGKCKYVLHRGNETFEHTHYLDALGAGLVIRDANALNIIENICKIEGNFFLKENFSNYVGPFHFYDKSGILNSNWCGYVREKDSVHTIKFYLNKQLEPCGYAWIEESIIPKNKHTINNHKVYMSASYNGGDNFPHQIIGRPFYGEPGSVCSQTYNCVGSEQNLNKLQCENIITYMQTRFFRYLVSIKKKTQGATSSVFQFVPLQDFSEPWTDEKLYKKYNLSPDEIDYIESLIKPMN